jgi:hypothetical protein
MLTQKRFGKMAIEKGFITEDQLREAINIQITSEIKNGESIPTGEILFDLGYINRAQIEEVRKEVLEQNTMECPNCGILLNKCPNCGVDLTRLR